MTYCLLERKIEVMKLECKESTRTGRWAVIWKQHGKIILATGAPGLLYLIRGFERGMWWNFLFVILSLNCLTQFLSKKELGT